MSAVTSLPTCISVEPFWGGKTTCFMPIKKKADVVGELASGEHRQNRKR